MKTAQIRVSGFHLHCPHCYGIVATGTECVWPQEPVLECSGCGAKVKRPSDKRLNAVFTRRKKRQP